MAKQEINFKDYFDTLTTEKQYNINKTTAKVEIYGYTKLGHMIESILNVCRQALEPTDLTSQFANNLDYCNLLELATDLIPHSELELLEKLHQENKIISNENN